MSGNEHPMTKSRPVTTIRVCLRCDKAFQSIGIGNRVCIPCQRLNDTTAQPARCEFLGRSQSEDSIARQVKLSNGNTGVE